MVDTGDEWGPNARKTIESLKPACAVLRFGDLASRPFDWPDLVHDEPEALSYRGEPFSLRPHQKTALDDVTGGFEAQDRGQLIMACGTGKTLAALRIAEAVAGIGGRVLYLVPSISLFQQSMREWATQRAIPHRYIGICSDTHAGRNDEDASLQELEIPVTTDPSTISRALRLPRPDAITVVFCTYHSLGIVERAQDDGAPAFDIVLCDEAHRTTGIERPRRPDLALRAGSRRPASGFGQQRDQHQRRGEDRRLLARVAEPGDGSRAIPGERAAFSTAGLTIHENWSRRSAGSSMSA